MNRKIKQNIFSKLFISAAFFALIFPLVAHGDEGRGGLFGNYSIGYEYNEAKFEDVRIEKIDFDNSNNFNNHLIDILGDIDIDNDEKQDIDEDGDRTLDEGAFVLWKGGIDAPAHKNYLFYFRRTGVDGLSITVDDTKLPINYGVSDPINLAKGWHEIQVVARVRSGTPNSRLQMYWNSPGTAATHPHFFQIDLGASKSISRFVYQPRQDGFFTGTVKDYRIYVSGTPPTSTSYGTLAASGTFPLTSPFVWDQSSKRSSQTVVFPVARTGRYITFVADSAANNADDTTSAADFDVFGTNIPARSSWRVHWADSEETIRGNFLARRAIDNNSNTFWQTEWSNAWEIVPENNLGYRFWADAVDLKIPKPGYGGGEKLDYKAVGVGIKGLSEAKFIVDATGITDKILEGNVLLIWANKGKTLRVTNENSGESEVITGTDISSFYSTSSEYSEHYQFLPYNLIDRDGNGADVDPVDSRLELKIKNPNNSPFDEGDGAALIIPYKDETAKKGYIYFRMLGASAYQGASPVMVFPLGKGIDYANPAFIFTDGETKLTINPVTCTGSPCPRVRPNYIYYLTGTGDSPSESSVLKNIEGSTRLMPQNGSVNLGDKTTWYPAFGREGPQYDLISPKYVPNEAVSYMHSREGLIEQIDVKEKSWIALQYYGSNFSGSGVNGSGESSSFTAGGMFSELSPNEFTLSLTVNPVSDGLINVLNKTDGITSYNCPPDCSPVFNEGTEIELTASPNPPKAFDKWTGDACNNSTNNICTFDMTEDKSITANFKPGASFVRCGTDDGGVFYAQPAANLCDTGAGDLLFGAVITTGSGWEWKCQNSLGELSGPCSASKNNAWQEVAPKF